MTLAESLGAFPRYMNRPLARVHVYSWRIACQLEQQLDWLTLGGGIRYLPKWRSPICKRWRKAVADYIRKERKAGNVLLPYYSEATGAYSLPFEEATP